MAMQLDQAAELLELLEAREIPTALRNTINDVAFDIMRRERKEIASIFDRPTALVSSAPRVVQRASKDQQTAVVALTASNDRAREALPKILGPYIPGKPSDRGHKAFEERLRGAGILASNQYLMPSRSVRRDRYGNVSRAIHNRIVQDLTSKPENPRYIWGTVNPRSGRPVTGVWLFSRWRRGQSGALVMLAVTDTPSYRKTFDFKQIAVREGLRVATKHAKAAVEHALARRWR